LRADLEAANRERDELAKWVVLAEKKISGSDAQLEAANKVVEAADEVWKSAEVFRFIGFNGYVVPAQKMLDAHAALASYRRSPDSNPQENNNER
jgi:hypothetical protein